MEFSKKIKAKMEELIILPAMAKEHFFRMLWAGILIEGVLLLEGPPGCAKSTVLELLAKAIGLNSSHRYRCNGNVGASNEEYVGGLDVVEFNKGNRAAFWSEWLTQPIGMIDEFDKLNPYVINVLLPVFAEYKAVVMNETKPLKRRFIGLTMNPFQEGQSNFKITNAMKDRIVYKLGFPSPTLGNLFDIYRSNDDTVDRMPVMGTYADLKREQDLTAKIPVSDEARLLVGALVRSTTACVMNAKSDMGNFPMCCATSQCPIAQGAIVCSKSYPLSTRAGFAMINLGKGVAAITGATEVTVEHIREVAPYCLDHRLEFPNMQPVDNRFEYISAFVSEMHVSANNALSVVAEAPRMLPADLERYLASSDPMVKEAAQYVEPIIAAAAAAQRSRLLTMSGPELQAIRNSLSNDEKAVVVKLVQARKVISVEIPDLDDCLSNPAFTNLFLTADGEAMGPEFMTTASWEILTTDGVFVEDILGIKVSYDSTAVKFEINDLPTADAFRQHLTSKIGAFGEVLNPYLAIQKDLKKLGLSI